jgi:hypothetical protein
LISSQAAELHVRAGSNGTAGPSASSAESPTWGRAGTSIWANLQDALDAAAEGDTIRIGPGFYRADPEPFTDPLCGNCLEHRTIVRASTGFRVTGKALVIIGRGPGQTVLSTGAGYGIYIEDSDGTWVCGLAVTGGRRDADGNATDAAIVVRRSRVILENLDLRDNTDRAEGVVVGVGGIMGREGAEIDVRRCRILNNGWDGVALYRGATARIVDNIIEEGRGAGIGITWDAAAIVLRNRISGYWKGIGTFGKSRAVVRNNAVFDNLGWGVIATGTSFLEATHHVIVRNGNCGFAVWSEDAGGEAANNIIAYNGWRKEWVCPRVGFWHAGNPDRFPAGFNLLYRNAAGAWLPGHSEPTAQPAEMAAVRSRPLMGQDGTTQDAGPPKQAYLEADPRFFGGIDFQLQPDSPAIDSGDPTRTDLDGSRSDIGLSGGPSARPRIGAPPPLLPAERYRQGSPAWNEAQQTVPDP